jgi:hypothetical protein
MWTARAVTLFLRRELDYPRLRVKLTPLRAADDKRWAVYEIRRRYFGPFEAGGMRFKEARDWDDEVYVHEGPNGEYQSLDPHLMLAALRKQDAWVKGNRPAAMTARVRASKEKRLREQSAMFEDLAMDSRRMIGRAADEMGL